MKTLSFLLSFFVLLFAGKEPAVSVSDTRVDYRLNGAVRFEKNRYFLYSDCYGVAYFDSRSGRSPEYRNNGLPTKVVYPFSEQNAYRPVTGMSVLNGERAAALFSLGLYVTGDGGLSWRQIPTAASNGLKSSNYFSSVALSPTDDKHILLGTSFNGIFETKDGGLTWNPINKTLNGFNSTFYRGADFYEEISALCYGSRPGVFYIAGGYGNGIYEADRFSSRLTKIPAPFTEEIISLRIQTENPAVLEIYTRENIRFYHTAERRWIERVDKLPRFVPPKDPEAEERLRKAADKTGIYINANHASGARLQTHLTTIAAKNLTSFVVDAKNDQGLVVYDSALDLPKAVGALYPRYRLEELIETADNRNLYVIARIVVFKDPKLYRYEKNRFAVWDSRSNEPWGQKFKEVDEETGEERWVQREFWVDPYNEEVWDYNIALAEELQARGVDEIQFDYIRFPTDGPVERCYYRHKRQGMQNIDALESFLKKARSKISIPISTDLYGYNCYYKMGNWMGQGIEMFSEYVDVISPMYYPSHFPRSFVYDEDYLRWSHTIYKEGTERAKSSVRNRCLIRPYVQAFRLPQEFWMEKAQYDRYVVEQVGGLKEADASGYTLWNNSNQYYMLDALPPEQNLLSE